MYEHIEGCSELLNVNIRRSCSEVSLPGLEQSYHGALLDLRFVVYAL